MKFFVENAQTRAKGNGLGYIDVGKLAATISVIRNGFKITKPLPVGDLYSNVAVPARRAR